jgi:O-antigen ligase
MIYIVVLPLALFLGYLLATPYQLSTLAIVGFVIAGLCLPIFLRWHYPLLIFAWNANIMVFFMPGRPGLWMLLAGISLGITVLNSVLDKRFKLQHVSSITWPLLFLLAVVLITAKLTGGIGLRSMGSAMYGGKKLVYIIAAVIGYFAISSHRIDPSRAQRFTSVYFLSGVTGVISNLLYIGGPAFYFLFLLFPVDNAMSQAAEDLTLGSTGMKFSRVGGAFPAALAGLCFLLARFGIRGLVDTSKPWRMIVALGVVGLSLLGGFRSAVLIVGLLFFVQFYFEGLYRTRLVIGVFVAALVAGAILVPTARHLPVSVQRSLSFLPLDVDPAARANAQNSLEWRLEMWRILVEQVPQYFWLGKGYAINPTDLYFAQEAYRRGLGKDYESALVSGDYHSGPLSVLIPFGIFGVIAFVWFLVASFRLLYRNYVYSDDNLRLLNTFLLSYFLARTIFYFVGFGGLYSDLPVFAGLVGLSIAVNGARRLPETSPAAVPQLNHAAAPA